MQLVLISFALALVCTPTLEIGTDAGTLLRIPLGPTARFSVTYWHSMYHAPLTEDFEITPERQLRLRAVRSRHGGVLEYLGLDNASEEHAMDRRFPQLSFLVATREPQTLIVGDRRWSFREFGAPGARLVFAPGADCGKK
jgi:hypothetical protein